MNLNLYRVDLRFLFAASLVLSVPGGSHYLAFAQPPSSLPQVEVLTRGPLHEAFAETIAFDPQPGVVVPQAPPDPIEELPPDQRPAGVNVAWIPGYWGWDDERNDFLWISGVWRWLPPGRQWVPGYWAQSQQGAQWTSGYWADAAASEVEYLPEPPVTVEAGPNVAAPDPANIWLPGYWEWQQNHYVWRPGYWAEGNQNWVWVPAHYVWSPSGYVFVDGYYDYDVPRRGVVFAPVYFQGGIPQSGFTYAPSAVISPLVFVSHLFVRPGYGHYYFGDYYGSNYASAGFSPWFSYQSSRIGYDPIYANQRWQHRSNPSWQQQVETNFRKLQDNEAARPPRNWAAQATLAGQTRDQRSIAQQLGEFTKSKDVPTKFQSVDAAERQQYDQRRQEYRKYVQQRQQASLHASTKPLGAATTTNAAARQKISRSPFSSLPADQLGKEYSPPPRHQPPQPNPQIQPQARKSQNSPHSGGRPPAKTGAGNKPKASATAPASPATANPSKPGGKTKKQGAVGNQARGSNPQPRGEARESDDDKKNKQKKK